MCSGPRAKSMHLRRSFARMSINDIPDRDGHVRTYVHHENRSLIQSPVLMHSAIEKRTIRSSPPIIYFLIMT